jgi:hypothetical protein
MSTAFSKEHPNVTKRLFDVGAAEGIRTSNSERITTLKGASNDLDNNSSVIWIVL